MTIEEEERRWQKIVKAREKINDFRNSPDRQPGLMTWNGMLDKMQRQYVDMLYDYWKDLESGFDKGAIL